MASVEGAKQGLSSTGKIKTPKSVKMGGEKWASERVDSIFNINSNALWAPRTRKNYEAILRRYYLWVWKHTGGEERKEIDDVKYIRAYLQRLAKFTSGEYIYKLWKVLSRLCLHQTPINIIIELEREAELLRRNANMKNPVKIKAADAVSLNTLENIMKESEYTKLTFAERTALEILAVAFMTMSRVGEIVELRVSDVSEDGTEIRLRPKTWAKKWLKTVKRVSDLGHIRAATFLKKRREAAIRTSTSLIYPARKESELVLSSSAVSQRLKRVMRKLGNSDRVTSHSGRKGSALEALLMGVPMVAIQSWGAWKDLRTLERYVGDALRRNVSLGDILAHRKRHRSTHNGLIWQHQQVKYEAESFKHNTQKYC